jgi:hypothetical protein
MTGMTWYSAHGSRLAELWTLLHLPYTLMAICFVLIGFSLNKPINWFITGTICLAYFFGLGVAAHCFDQLPGQGTIYVKIIKPEELKQIGFGALSIAFALGTTLIITERLWILLPLMLLQTFFAFAYPMSKLFNGYFHNDWWFAVGFGAVPFLTGYIIGFSNAGASITSYTVAIAINGAIICLMVSLIEILLSRFVRRARANSAMGADREYRPQFWWYRVETALKILCITVYVSTATLLLL